MSTRLSIVSNARHVAFALVWALVAVAAFTSAGQQAPPAVPPESSAAAAAPEAPAAEPSEAEQHFRAGVSLYNRGLFLEALSEFNRALALQPEHENAKLYRDKANAKLAITSAGGDAAAVAAFETVDPEALAAPTEGPQLSAEEMKIKRVAELLKKADLYLENLRYEQAVKLYEEVLLIAPDNSRAREGLHLATVGASRNEIDQAEKKIQEDRAQIRKYIEKSKQLPEGADPTGIKEFRISVPIAEEEYVAPEQKSEIEGVLDSFVSIEFENIHLIEILDFISESYDVNIVPDDRVIMRPQKAAPAPAAAPAPVPGAFPGGPPGARPGGGPPAPGGRPAAPARPAPAPAGGAAASAMGAMGDFVTDGMVPYIALQNVPLRDALKALLRPLNLEFAVQPGFIWISTPEKIRLESFEALETRYYELRNAGAETLFKIVLRNPGGGGGMMGGMGGGMMGGMGGGMMGGMGGGYGGGRMGGMGGGYGGGMGGMGGGYGGGMMGGRGGMMGGGMMGGGGGIQIQNISQLFGSLSDLQVGETPAIIGTAGLSTGGTGNVGSARVGGAYGGGANAANGPAGLGTTGRSDNLSGDEPEIVRLLRLLVDDVYEPNGTEPISRMIYVPHNNQLIVVNTPTNLAKLEKQLSELDVTPKQVSIEAKFLTIKAEDLDKIGFKWNVDGSDVNGRNREIAELQNSTTPASYEYDINGDGVKETIPFYKKPSGANVITNTVTSAVMEALANPGPTGNFSLSGIITQNEDGDKLSVVMDYLNTLEESELLSAPRVTTMNRKPAVIADLTTEYFVASVHSEIVTTEGTLGGSGRLGYIQRIQPQPFNFGITLSVTPQISGSDQVRLWLNPQVTTRGLEKKFIQRTVIEGNEIEDEITLPNTSTQAVWTNVIVHDGDTLVLGGLVSDQTITGTHKLPYLADIPVVGFFFRGKSKQVKQSSLLIFVTPTIIDTTGARYYEADTGSAMMPASAPVPVAPGAESTLEEASPLVESAPEALVEPEPIIEPLEKAPEDPAKI